MDFNAALAVLQQHGKNKEALPITASPTAATGPVQSCVECAESEQTEAVKTDLAGNTLPQLLRLLLAKQEERVAVYKRFEEGFLLFLQVAEATGYEELVRRTTATFATISGGINTVEAELKRRGSGELATTVRRVQEMEREKLELTARHQILRHGLAVDQLHADGLAADEATAAAAARTAPRAPRRAARSRRSWRASRSGSTRRSTRCDASCASWLLTRRRRWRSRRVESAAAREPRSSRGACETLEARRPRGRRFTFLNTRKIQKHTDHMRIWPRLHRAPLGGSCPARAPTWKKCPARPSTIASRATRTHRPKEIPLLHSSPTRRAALGAH